VFGWYNGDDDCSGVMGALKMLSNSIQEVIDAKGAKDADAEKAGYEKMSKTLDMFSSSHNEIVTEQTKFGGVYNRLEMTESTLGTNAENLTSYLSSMQDIDIADAASKWMQAQYSYQASLQVAAATMNMSLLNYL
jgi:flagellin-like hook-associated protein FlgL